MSTNQTSAQREEDFVILDPSSEVKSEQDLADAPVLVNERSCKGGWSHLPSLNIHEARNKEPGTSDSKNAGDSTSSNASKKG